MEHMVRALFLRPESFMAVIIKPDPPTLYCDASKSFGESYTVVAGAIASVQDWLDFDSEWSAALSAEGLQYFRMTEFAHSRGEFAIGDWKHNEERRRIFFRRLAQIIVEHVACWVGVAISRKGYEAADRIYELHEYTQPYTICALTCIDLARKWQAAQHLDYLPLECVFEEGDEHTGQLWQRCKEWYGGYPSFKKKVVKNPTDVAVTPLQVGDIAAYEIGKAYSLLDPEIEDLFVRFRTSFGLLGNVPHHWGQIREISLRSEANVRGLHRRQ